MSTVVLCIVIVYILPGKIILKQKIGKKNISLCIFIKMFSNEQVYPYDSSGFLRIQNEKLNFSTTKMAVVLISRRNARRLTHIL